MLPDTFQRLDFDKYDYVFQNSIMCMDKFHIDLMYNILLQVMPTYNGEALALEIGSYHGASSLAFLMVKAQEDFDYHICDIEVPQPMHRLIYEFNSTKLKTLMPPTVHILSSLVLLKTMQKINLDPDIIFIDGDHSKANVTKELEAIKQFKYPPSLILAHDTNSENVGFPECDGPPLIKQYCLDNNYTIFEDKKARDGMRTDRGFLAASNDTNIVSILETLFSKL